MSMWIGDAVKLVHC